MTQDTDWEALYRETRHRIGNTMQMLLSLLRLQMRKETPDARDALARLEVRMSAAAAAYALARVVGEDGVTLVVDFAAYIGDMSEEARRQTEPDMAPEVTLDLVPAEIPLDQAIPAGVAITEVLMNAVQHGGPPIHVRMEALAEAGVWRVAIRDGGTGVPEAGGRGDGLGLRIAESLMRQVKGRLATDGGTVTLEWPAR
ncbi:sensor histidine kinase [Caenispirillum bisanense]|uniref:histidine kinase n=1 Tax=Caenispirillum bisanense TaxID=414052 RepID=A0A286GZQ0_9PROT|nr:sensor histidine kinase [Caenispirillum bisanense]SOE01018.1 Two-component sensor histidine kinase, contains HisKA and HATPase domains [Caenispirillum bisanense]